MIYISVMVISVIKVLSLIKALPNINMQTARLFKVQVTQLYLDIYLYIILLYKVSLTTYYHITIYHTISILTILLSYPLLQLL